MERMSLRRSLRRYAFLDGRLVDMAEKRDLTQARLEALARIRFDALPLEAAIKTVRGSGARRLAVFEDPACPVCRSLQQSLAALDDVTIYTFTYPVIARESIPAAVSTWCAPARSASTSGRPIWPAPHRHGISIRTASRPWRRFKESFALVKRMAFATRRPCSSPMAVASSAPCPATELEAAIEAAGRP